MERLKKNTKGFRTAGNRVGIRIVYLLIAGLELCRYNVLLVGKISVWIN
jgi:hypothetical protein